MSRLLCLLILLPLFTGHALAQETGTVIVANMSDNTVTLFDAATRQEIVTLPSGPAPHEVSVSPSGEWAIVTNYGDRGGPGQSLSLINVREAKVQETFDLGVYQRPHGVFFLPGDSVVAVTSEVMQTLVFVDIRTGEIVDTLSTLQRGSHMLASDRSGAHMFTTNVVDGTITEFDGLTRQRGRLLPVAAFVEGIAISPGGERAWVGSNAKKAVYVVDVESGAIETTFEDFGFPYRMAVTPNGKYALLCDPGRSEIRVIDARSLEHLKTIRISAEGAQPSAEFSGSAAPEGLVITPDSRYAYVSLQALNQVAAIDLESFEIIGRFDTGVWPDGIGYSPVTAEMK